MTSRATPVPTFLSADPLLRVYVAAPYRRAGLVRALMATTPHVRWTSRWAMGARGPEQLETLTRDEQRRLAAGNDEDLADSHVVLAIAFPGEGGEMFSEIGRALMERTPVIWTGPRKTLSTAREGVLFVDGLEAAVGVLADLAVLATRGLDVDLASMRRRIWSTLASAGAHEATE
jgi:hypothetical protein